MKPSIVLRNFTPSSTAMASCSVMIAGTVDDGQMVHGQLKTGAVVVAKLAGWSATSGLTVAFPTPSAERTR